MNGVHDMGGLQGYGPVLIEANEPLFHGEWERRALGVTVAMGASGLWNIDLARSARESLPPLDYVQGPYYAIWTKALQNMLIERGLITAEELAQGQPLTPPVAGVRVLQAAEVDAALAKGSPADRPSTQAPRFAVGQRVRALNLNPQGHTRLPRYVRGHVGTVVLHHGSHVLPDQHVNKMLPPFDGTGEHLYTVVFDGTELWGPQAEAGHQVSVDAWESYLEAVPNT
jgi:nitrile hydratase